MNFENSICCGKAVYRKQRYPKDGLGKQGNILEWYIRCSQCQKECETKKTLKEKAK